MRTDFHAAGHSSPAGAGASAGGRPGSLEDLQRAWRRRVLMFAAALAAAATGLAAAWAPGYALRWAAFSALASVYVFWVLWRGLPENHRPGESRLLPRLGLANELSLTRGLLIAALAGLLFVPWPGGWLIWLPGVLYAVAASFDFLDGYAARRSGQVTRLGARLDLSLDGVGVLLAVLLAVHYGQLPVWYILVGLARYLFLAGLWLRRRLGLPVYDLPPSALRRVLASAQMGFAAVMLFPVFGPPETHQAALLFGLPFLIGFARDWLSVSGVLRPSEKLISPERKNRREALRSAVVRWLPVLLRLAVVALMIGPLSRRLVMPAVQAVFEHFSINPSLGLIVVTLLEAGVLVFLLLGAAGRLAAIAGLLLLAGSHFYIQVSAPQVVAAFLYTLIIYLGTGALSLWKPEDPAFRRAVGPLV